MFVSPTEGKEGHVSGLNNVLIALHGGKETILSLVTALGDSLTSKDEVIRGRGTLLLSEVLNRLPSLSLTPNDRQFLMDFFTVRLLDTAVIPEVVLGLRSIVKRLPEVVGSSQAQVVDDDDEDNNDNSATSAAVDDDDKESKAGAKPSHEDRKAEQTEEQTLSDEEEQVVNMLNSLFDNVHTQSQRQATRQAIFELLFLVTEKCAKAVARLRAQFAYGLVQAIDGEKDPRCLILAFKLVTFAVKHVPGTLRFVDELFDVICVYFPISFTAREGAQVTPEVLAQALDEAMASHAAVARLAVPFFLERFSTSDEEDTQKASLDALVQCVDRYGHNTIAPVFDQLWPLMKRHLLTALSDGQIKMTATALQKIVGSLSRQQDGTPMRRFVEAIVEDCVRVLSEDHGDDQVTVTVIGRVLSYSIACAAAPACELLLVVLLSAVNQHVSPQQQQRSEAEERVAEEWLGLLSEVLHNVTAHYAGDRAHSLLRPHADTLYAMLSQLFDQYLPAIHAAVSIACASTELLEERKRRDLVLTLTNLMLSAVPRTSTKLACLQGLAKLADKGHTALLTELSLPSVFELDAEQSSWQETILGTLGGHPQLFDCILAYVLSSHRYSALEEIVDRSTANESAVAALVTKVAVPLLQQARSDGTSTTSEVRHRIAMKIARAADAEQQCALLGIATEAILSGSRSPTFLQLLAVARRSSLGTGVSRALISALFSLESAHQAAGSLPTSSFDVASALGGLANKLDPAQLADDFLGPHEQQIANNPLVFVTVTRALYMRSYHPTASTMLATALDAVASADDDRSGQVTGAFEKVFGPTEQTELAVFAADSDCAAHPLYKQRLFCQAVPLIRSLFEQASNNERRSRLLRCAAPLFGSVPRSVLLAELPKFFPLLLHSLDATDQAVSPSILLTAFATLKSIENPEFFADNIVALLRRLHPLTTFKASMHVRIEAIKALQRLTILPFSQLYPHQQQIARALELALDDKKRLVRQAASQCRCVWLQLQ